METPKVEDIGKLTKIISKNPISFVASVFFLMFWITYYIHVRRADDEANEWKMLYLKEREDKDRFRIQLLEKAGIIEQQNEIIKNSAEILKENTEKESKEILKSKKK